MKERKPIGKEAALLKMATLCARTEQSETDIRGKLRRQGLDSADIEAVIEELKERKFLDNSRFARAFARDKVRFAGWGKIKIRSALATKGIKGQEADKALAEIEESDYTEALQKSARAKARGLNLDERDGRVKLFRHLLSRGFEYDLAMETVKQLLRERKERENEE